jgi:hypothetical protein
MRNVLANRMKSTNDPALDAFEHRNEPAMLDTFMRRASRNPSR